MARVESPEVEKLIALVWYTRNGKKREEKISAEGFTGAKWKIWCENIKLSNYFSPTKELRCVQVLTISLIKRLKRLEIIVIFFLKKNLIFRR